MKYLNRDSTHPTYCFKAITKGVFKRLSNLTSLDDKNKNEQIKDLYPCHHKAIQIANLTIPPTTLQEKINSDNVITKTKPTKDPDRRHIYFCLVFSHDWPILVSKLIRKLIKSYGL